MLILISIVSAYLLVKLRTGFVDYNDYMKYIKEKYKKDIEDL